MNEYQIRAGMKVRASRLYVAAVKLVEEMEKRGIPETEARRQLRAQCDAWRVYLIEALQLPDFTDQEREQFREELSVAK